MRKFLFICLSLAFAWCMHGQTPERDTIAAPPDTLTSEVPTNQVNNEDKSIKPAKRIPIPRKATIYSLALPGAGQVYNGQWWKVPIIYGAGYLFYDAITTNTENYKTFRDAYILRVDDDPETVDQFEGILSENGLKSRRDFYNKNRQLSLIGVSVLYLLNGLDAFISAHLRSFDISDDLSLEYHSVPSFSQSARIPGVSITYALNGKERVKTPPISP